VNTMPRPFYYILKNGVPVIEHDLIRFERFFRNIDNRRIAYTEISKDVHVSTVFLGMDHQWGDGPPLLFETMVFGGDFDEWQYRYATLEEAIAGHYRAVTMVDPEWIHTENQ